MSSITTPTSAIHPENYRYLQNIVYQGSGIVLDHDKHYLLASRLATIVRRNGVQSINDLCSLLRGAKQPAVLQQVVEAMTTNETFFFREPAQYDAIRTTLLPQLKELRSRTHRLSFWSAASSAGQEAYSLAMLLAEQGLADWNPQIVGTDLSMSILERARLARYLQLEVNRGLPTPLLLKYFRKQGLDWDLVDSIKRMVRFEQFDLRRPMHTLGPFDLVFCRNVLVYFDAPTRHKILKEIHRTMLRGSWLLLGTTEAPAGLNELFDQQCIGGCIVHIAQ